MISNYSYLSPLTGSNFEAFIAGKIETIIVIKNSMERKDPASAFKKSLVSFSLFILLCLGN